MCNAQAIQAGVQGTLSIGGGILGAYGAYQEGEYAKKQGQYNASLAYQAEKDALARGQQAEQVSRMKSSLVQGQQRTAIAASGIDVQSGSALDVMAQSKAMSEVDAQTIRNNAAREAWGFRVQAQQALQQGELEKRKSRYQMGASMIGGFSGAGGSFTQMGTSIAQQYGKSGGGK